MGHVRTRYITLPGKERGSSMPGLGWRWVWLQFLAPNLNGFVSNFGQNSHGFVATCMTWGPGIASRFLPISHRFIIVSTSAGGGMSQKWSRLVASSFDRQV